MVIKVETEKMETGKKETEEMDLESVKRYVRIWKSYDGAYFWHPEGNARGRRNAEKYNTFEYHFCYDDHVFSMYVSMSQSCKNVYVTRMLTRDGKRVTIRALSKYVGE